MAAREQVADEAGTCITLQNFPRCWTSDGKDMFLASLQAQLTVFGPLASPPMISNNLQEAEVTFVKATSAKEAIEVLNGIDFREPEEIEKNPKDYTGLAVALKPRGQKRMPLWGQHPQEAQHQYSSLDAGLSSSPTFAPFVGTWSIGYEGGVDDMVYTISETGEVRVGKKRFLQLVLAGSAQDHLQDPNYAGMLLLNNAHREDTWEYIWLEEGLLRIHHFTSEDSKISPFGSPHFWGVGLGQPSDQVRQDAWQSPVRPKRPKTWGGQQSWGERSWGHQPWGQQGWGRQQSWQQEWHSPPVNSMASMSTLGALEGVWTIVYQGDVENSMTYTFSAYGDVTVGKKRHLKLAPAGTKQDNKRDPNYGFEGVFLLDQCHRDDTWEYLWIESGVLQVHHFTAYDTGFSPFGSPHFWGQGVGAPGHEPLNLAALQQQAQPRRWAPVRPPGPIHWPRPLAWAPPPPPPASPSLPSGGPSYWRQVGAWKAEATGGYPAAPASRWRGSAAAQAHGWDANTHPVQHAGGPQDPATTTVPETAEAVGPLEGTWSVDYDPGGGGMTYVISDTGEVKIGKKRRGQLVLAGSEWDVKGDTNYIGSFFLNNPHREDTWEYVWIEDDRLQLHHFSGDDTGLSPLGSSNFYGVGVGTRKVV